MTFKRKQYFELCKLCFTFAHVKPVLFPITRFNAFRNRRTKNCEISRVTSHLKKSTRLACKSTVSLVENFDLKRDPDEGIMIEPYRVGSDFA